MALFGENMSIELDTTMKDMQKRMSLLLQSRGKTADEVSKFIVPYGNVPNIISKWINGDSNITTKRLIAATEIFDTTVDYLFCGIGSNIKISELYSPILNIEEKDLFVNFQNISSGNQRLLLKFLKSLVPQNAFDKSDFVNRNGGDFAKAEDAIKETLVGVGTRLKTILKARKITQKTLAEGMGLHPAMCSKIIKGERIVSYEALLMICKYFDIVPSDLLCNHTEPDNIEGFTLDISDLIVYFRMLDTQNKGKILAISKLALEYSSIENFI